MTNSGKRVSWVTAAAAESVKPARLRWGGWLTVVVSGRRKDALEAVVAGIYKERRQAEASCWMSASPMT